MSLFLGNATQYSTASVDPQKLKLAEIQYDAMSSTFNLLLSTCREKCVPAVYGENELNTGEMCCVDRCVAKYVKANHMVGTNLQVNGFVPENMPEYRKVQTILNLPKE